MKLNPDLLRACAAYLAHADAYGLDGDGVLALLRPVAAKLLAGRSVDVDEHEREWPNFGIRAKSDELVRTYLDAIRRNARDHVVVDHRRDVRAQQQRNVEVVLVARAILDATPDMLVWWCVRLSKGAVSP